MCDDDSVIWPSTLPPCSVSAAIVTAIQIQMAQQIDEAWRACVDRPEDGN